MALGRPTPTEHRPRGPVAHAVIHRQLLEHANLSGRPQHPPMFPGDEHADELAFGVARVADEARPIAAFLRGDGVPAAAAERIGVVDVAAVVRVAAVRDDFADVLGPELLPPDWLEDADPDADVVDALHRLDKRLEDSAAAGRIAVA